MCFASAADVGNAQPRIFSAAEIAERTSAGIQESWVHATAYASLQELTASFRAQRTALINQRFRLVAALKAALECADAQATLVESGSKAFVVLAERRDEWRAALAQAGVQ